MLYIRKLPKRSASGSQGLMIDKNGQIFVTEIGALVGSDFIGSDLVYLSTGYDFHIDTLQNYNQINE